MGLNTTFLPHNYDIEFNGQSWQAGGKRSNILGQVDNMSTVTGSMLFMDEYSFGTCLSQLQRTHSVECE